MSNDNALTLAQVEAFDPNHSRRIGGESRACCPSCGVSKPVDVAHRSLSYNAATGLYRCHRAGCEQRGQFKEFWKPLEEVSQGRQRLSKRERLAAQTHAAFRLGEPAPPRQSVPPQPVATTNTDLGRPDTGYRARVGALRSIVGSPASDYLRGRGFCFSDPAIVALFTACRVRFSPNFGTKEGWERGHGAAIVFPVRNQRDELVAVCGRLLVPKPDKPKAITFGKKSDGIFATPSALTGDVLVITEAPVDALTLALCGVPAVALLGTAPIPQWLVESVVSKTVYLAFDSDAPGEADAAKHVPVFHRAGATRVTRLRPTGAKDWNELLQKEGAAAMRERLAQLVTKRIPHAIHDTPCTMPAKEHPMNAGIPQAQSALPICRHERSPALGGGKPISGSDRFEEEECPPDADLLQSGQDAEKELMAVAKPIGNCM